MNFLFLILALFFETVIVSPWWPRMASKEYFIRPDREVAVPFAANRWAVQRQFILPTGRACNMTEWPKYATQADAQATIAREPALALVYDTSCSLSVIDEDTFDPHCMTRLQMQLCRDSPTSNGAFWVIPWALGMTLLNIGVMIGWNYWVELPDDSIPEERTPAKLPGSSGYIHYV